MVKYNISYKRVLSHLVYWVIFIFSFPIFYNLITVNSFDLYPKQVRNVAAGAFYLIFATYFITYYLVPVFLIRKKKYLKFIILYFITFIIITIVDIFLTYIFVIPRDYPELLERYFSFAFKFKNILKTFFIIHLEVFIFMAIRFFIHYLKDYFEKEKLNTRIIETELNILRGQIHPHFLFNTLNNIYTMSLDSNNSMLTNSVAKMSEILRFILYECNTEYISLETELKIIKDYIDLEKLRYSKLNLEIKLPSEYTDIYIIPLILFTFVENAFKHGVSKSINNKWIKIDLHLKNNSLYFNIRNCIGKNKSSKTLNKIKGLGIENANKRLELAYDKKNYKLELKKGDSFFEVNLVINEIKTARQIT